LRTVRAILGVLLGLGIAAFLVTFAEQEIYGRYPAPPNLDWSDAAQVKRFIGAFPLGAHFALVTTWVGSTLLGALVGSSVARPRAILISVIVGGLMLAATIGNFLLTPHPLWLVLSTMTGIVIATGLAAKLMWKPERPSASA
jgi:hypothetical protein